MNKFKILRVALVVATVSLGIGADLAPKGTGTVQPGPKRRITQAERQAAALRARQARAKALAGKAAGVETPGATPARAARGTAARTAVSSGGGGASAAAALVTPTQGGIPDYFSITHPNWAFSPPLRKFVDTLPGLNYAGRNNLQQYIPVGIPDTTTYPGSDYYEIELGEFTQQMHSDLPPTTLRGYRQTNTTDTTVSAFHYLGPVIVAQKDKPVRIKFTNKLPTGAAGKLFLPVDPTLMGAGPGPTMPNWNGTQHADALCASAQNQATPRTCFSENRADLHLHGGRTPWISDGTPHQWITPAGEVTDYPKGVSMQNVPDMPDPGPGSQTYYYTNQQSARLMFYHDHASGITRLNVYAGQAAGYVIRDAKEQELITAGLIPPATAEIPLIIQDKTFVDANTVLATDPTWNWGTGTYNAATGTRQPKTGDLWWPHVYVPAQNPYDISGVNPTGRWAYGPWFWPPTNDIAFPPVTNPYYDPTNAPWEPPEMPGTPNTSWGAEAFMDTPVVNGVAYPTLTVEPKSYRFRVLNASHDRFWNLQLYQADPAVSVGTAGLTEVKMVPALRTTGFPPNWPSDGREGGVPDPALVGPNFIQIGTEGGLLPKPAVVVNQPVTWNMNPTTFNFGNVQDHALLLGPAERADVIVDFSAYAGKTLILYNDAPAAFPALDPRLDYYTGKPDHTMNPDGTGPGDGSGGSGTTLPGFGPNTRTIMQIKVAGTAAPAFDLAALQAAFDSTAAGQGAFAASQEPIIVGQALYNSTYNTTFPTTYPNWGVVRIQDNSVSFRTVAGTTVTQPMLPKAIHDEMGAAYDEYGRMSAKLGLEVPFTGNINQTFILQNYVDPPTENVSDGAIQIWKITHNGVDTHPVHFHLFDVQLLNRVGWDGAIRLPDDNELGWKDTVRMSPLEDTIVALRPIAPKQPFGIPDSRRPLNPALPNGATAGFTNLDTNGQPLNPPTVNGDFNFGWEYVWHCHILSHEEADMMRPITFQVARTLPAAPALTAQLVGTAVNLTWTDATPVVNPVTPANLGNPANEIGFRIERATITNGTPGAYSVVATAIANSTTYSDATAGSANAYSYRVVAFNAAGDSPSAPVTILPPAPAAPSGLTATLQAGQAVLSWTDNATNEAGFVLQRSVNGGAFAAVTPAPGPRTGTGTVNYTATAALTPGSTYTYRVAATNAGGQSAFSNTASLTVPAPPAAPTALSATLQGNQVVLTWTDNATNETGFVLQRQTNTGAFTALVPAPGPRTNTGSVTYTDTTVAAGNTYTYRVQAVNGAGSSAFSNTATATLVSTPAAPTGLTATQQAGPQVALSWTDNATNETGFSLERSTNGGAFTVLTPAPGPRTGTGNVTYTNTGVAAGNTYSYRVRAVNAAGNSAYSNTATVTIAAAVPAAPSNVTLARVLTFIRVRFTDNANNESSFAVARSLDGTNWTQVATAPAVAGTGGTGTVLVPISANGAIAGQPNFFRVQAINASGSSAWAQAPTTIVP